MRHLLILPVLAIVTGCAVQQPLQNNTGNRLLQRERVDLAVRNYQYAQVTDPDVALPYFNMGVAYLQAEEYLRAEAALNQSLRTVDAETAGEVYYALGEVYFRLGRYQQSAVAYRETLQRNPADDDARYNMELALSLIPSPSPMPSDSDSESNQSTPTASPSPTQSESQEDGTPTVTPTPSPQPDAGDEPPTATPPGSPPEENEDPDGEPTQVPQTDLEQLLDDKSFQQDILPIREDDVEAGAPPEKDW